MWLIELHERRRPGCSSSFYSALSKYSFNTYAHGDNVFALSARGQRPTGPSSAPTRRCLPARARCDVCKDQIGTPLELLAPATQQVRTEVMFAAEGCLAVLGAQRFQRDFGCELRCVGMSFAYREPPFSEQHRFGLLVSDVSSFRFATNAMRESAQHARFAQVAL